MINQSLDSIHTLLEGSQTKHKELYTFYIASQ